MAVQSVIVVRDPLGVEPGSSSWTDRMVVKNAPPNLGDGWRAMKAAAGRRVVVIGKPHGSPFSRRGYSVRPLGTSLSALFSDDLVLSEYCRCIITSASIRFLSRSAMLESAN